MTWFIFGQLFMWIGPIMTRYDFLYAEWVILSNIRPDSLYIISLLVIFSCELPRANNDQIWLHTQLTIYGCSKLSCCNIFQKSFKNYATMLPQNIVRKHLHNIMATFIHSFWQCRSVKIFTTFLQYGKIHVDPIRTCFRKKMTRVKSDAHTISLADFIFNFQKTNAPSNIILWPLNK